MKDVFSEAILGFLNPLLYMPSTVLCCLLKSGNWSIKLVSVKFMRVRIPSLLHYNRASYMLNTKTRPLSCWGLFWLIGLITVQPTNNYVEN